MTASRSKLWSILTYRIPGPPVGRMVPRRWRRGGPPLAGFLRPSNFAFASFFDLLARGERLGIPTSGTLQGLEDEREGNVWRYGWYFFWLAIVFWAFALLFLALDSVKDMADTFQVLRALPLVYGNLEALAGGTGYVGGFFFDIFLLWLVAALFVHGRYPGSMGGLARRLRLSVERGSKLSEAMEEHGRFFRAYEIETVRSGEKSGSLAPVLSHLADTYRTWRLAVRLVESLIYPALVLAWAACVESFILIFIMPRFVDIFHDLGAPLPYCTDLLIRVSEVVRYEGWKYGLVALLLLLIALHGRLGPVAAMSYIPGLRHWFVAPELTRFFFVLGTLLEARIPAPEAIRAAGAAGGTRRARAMAERVAGRVERGSSISDATLSEGLIPLRVRRLVHLSECNEAVPAQSIRISQWLREDYETRVQKMTGVLVPVSILLVGLTAGFIALAVYSPVFYLGSHIPTGV